MIICAHVYHAIFTQRSLTRKNDNVLFSFCLYYFSCTHSSLREHALPFCVFQVQLTRAVCIKEKSFSRVFVQREREGVGEGMREEREREREFASKSRIINCKEILINSEVENQNTFVALYRENLSARAILYDAYNGNNRFISSCDGANYAYHDFVNLSARTTSLNAFICEQVDESKICSKILYI